MKIYAVGDSFTAGSELADHEFFADFPGFCTYNDRNQPGGRPDNIFKVWETNRYRRVVCSPEYPRIRAREQELSYAQQLGKLRGLPVINEGVGGCSMQTIQRSLYKFLQTNTEPTVILYQPTHWTRWSQYYEFTWRDIMVGMDPDSLPSDLQAVFKFRIVNETQYSWMHSWFDVFYSCVELIRQHRHTQDFRIVNAGFISQIISEYDRPEFGDIADRLKSYLKEIKPWIIDLNVHSRYDGNLCPGGHFNYTVHRDLAEHLNQHINYERS